MTVRLRVSRPFDPAARVGYRKSFGVSGGAEALLRAEATWWIDALYAGDSQTVTNLGTGGTALNATLGSSGSADSNDPKFLAYEGTPYVYLPGVAGNYLSVPDSNALDITGDIDIRCLYSTDSANTGVLIAKSTGDGNQQSYYMQINSSGTIVISWSTDGATLVSRTSTASVNAVGSKLWLRAVLDVDNGAAGHDAKFYQSVDGSTWTQVGNAVTTAGTTSIYSSTSLLFIGARNSGGATSPVAGNVYRAQVYNGINGTLALDVDCSKITSGSATSFTEQSSNAATVTINRATSGRKAVAVVGPCWLLGTDDYLEVADNDLLDFGASDSFTALAVVRQWANPTDLGLVLSKSDGYDNGYALINAGTTSSWRALIDVGGTEVSRNLAYTLGASHVRTMVVNRSAQTLMSYSGTTGSTTSDITALGSLTNALPLRIGRSAGTTTNYQDFEFIAAAVFRRALTAAEVQAITSYYQARYS